MPHWNHFHNPRHFPPRKQSNGKEQRNRAVKKKKKGTIMRNTEARKGEYIGSEEDWTQFLKNSKFQMPSGWREEFKFSRHAESRNGERNLNSHIQGIMEKTRRKIVRKVSWFGSYGEEKPWKFFPKKRFWISKKFLRVFQSERASVRALLKSVKFWI